MELSNHILFYVYKFIAMKLQPLNSWCKPKVLGLLLLLLLLWPWSFPFYILGYHTALTEAMQRYAEVWFWYVLVTFSLLVQFHFPASTAIFAPRIEELLTFFLSSCILFLYIVHWMVDLVAVGYPTSTDRASAVRLHIKIGQLVQDWAVDWQKSNPPRIFSIPKDPGIS